MKPTDFTQKSASLIDLIQVRMTASVLTIEVTNNFLLDKLRFGCWTVLSLNFIRPSIKTIPGHIGTYHMHMRILYNYRRLLSENDSVDELPSNDDVAQNVRFIMQTIVLGFEQFIPNKIVTVRPAQHLWISCIKIFILYIRRPLGPRVLLWTKEQRCKIFWSFIDFVITDCYYCFTVQREECFQRFF